MSGSTIGSFVGAGIGFLIGGPAGAKIGWMVGGIAGGLIAPEKIYGPRLTDARSQTASDGVPRTYGYGTFPTTGNILWRDPTINEVETEEDGKGGPKQITYTYTRSYAIGVCRGPIAGYLIIKRNGKIVYDTRTNAELTAIGYTSDQIAETRAAQAKWQEVATLYYGNDDQLPDPTIQAVKGAGNVPAYRGSAYIVCTDDDVTELQGAVPQYEFVVSACGTVTEPIEYPFLWMIQSRAATPYTLYLGSADALTWNDSVTSVNTHYPAVTAAGEIYMGADVKSVDFGATFASIPGTQPALTSPIYALNSGRLIGFAGTDIYYSDDGWLTYTTVAFGATVEWMAAGGDVVIVGYNSGFRRKISIDGGATFGSALTNTQALSSGGYDPDTGQWVFGGSFSYMAWSANDGASLTYVSVSGGNQSTHVCPVGNGAWISIPRTNTAATSNRVFRSADGKTGWASVTTPSCKFEGSETLRAASYGGITVLAAEDSAGYLKILRSDDGCVSISEVANGYGVNPSYGVGVAVFSGYIAPPGALENPDAPGTHTGTDGTVTGPGGTQVDRCLVVLGDVVEDQCAVRGVTSVDVSELTDDLDGFRVSSETSPQRNIQALQVGYFFDGAEYDGVLHFPKRGAAATFALTEEDFVSRDGDPVVWEVTKENELLRKVTVGYIDPATTYTPTTQNWERRAGTIAAQGEGTVDLAVTGNKDWAKQAAEKTIKAAWAETKECKFSVSIAHAALVTGQVGTIPSNEGGTHLIRITRIEDDGDVRHITARKTQPNAYGSTATGVVIDPPQFPGGGLSGPTISAVMNLPVLREADDKAGVYWAATGLLTSWPGAVLTLARNGVTFENGPQMTVPCTMGVLTAALPTASRYALDTTNTLSVRLYPGASDLANASYDDLIETEANTAAILYADGTGEILQFTTRTVTGTREYDLTGLLRGRLDTAIATHAEGAVFVLLDDNVRFAAIKASDVGKTLTFRAVSFGSVADSNTSQTLVMSTIESLREWSPYNVTVESDREGGFCVEWIGRGRLGNSRAPTNSQWFDGYRVTFTISGIVYTLDTDEQSACVTAATMATTFGTGYGFPQVAVMARSRVVTNDDDFDSPPGVPGNPIISEPTAFSGTFPGGFVGVPYVLFSGDAGVLVSGGGWDANAYGYIAPGVCVSGSNMLSEGFRAIGIPHTAGTALCDVDIDGASPVPGESGAIAISHSVAIAAKPAYSTNDIRFRAEYGNTLVATTPPWTTFDMDGGQSLYSYGFDSGQRRAEFTISSAAGTVWIGINGQKGDLTPADSTVGVGFAMTDGVAYQAGNGTFAIEYDAGTGAYEIFEDGVGSVASGTFALPSGNQARFACTNAKQQTVRVKSNFGNESWVISPTGGFGGVPMPTVVIPVGWEAPTPTDGMMMSGNGYIGTQYGEKRITPTQHVALGTQGKSSGKWRVGISGAYVGICVAAFDRNDGVLGFPGTENSVSWDGQTLRWCLSGTSGSMAFTIPSYGYPLIFAVDADNDTLSLCHADLAGGCVTAHEMSLPAGQTWFPAEVDSYPGTSIFYSPAGPSGYSDWTLTV